MEVSLSQSPGGGRVSDTKTFLCTPRSPFLFHDHVCKATISSLYEAGKNSDVLHILGQIELMSCLVLKEVSKCVSALARPVLGWFVR